MIIVEKLDADEAKHLLEKCGGRLVEDTVFDEQTISVLHANNVYNFFAIPEESVSRCLGPQYMDRIYATQIARAKAHSETACENNPGGKVIAFHHNHLVQVSKGINPGTGKQIA